MGSFVTDSQLESRNKKQIWVSHQKSFKKCQTADNMKVIPCEVCEVFLNKKTVSLFMYLPCRVVETSFVQPLDHLGRQHGGELVGDPAGQLTNQR